MKLYRYNYKRGEYKPQKLKRGQNYTSVSEDMNKVVRCINCNEVMIYKDSYTSKEYKDENGIGFCICKDCLQKEQNKWGKNIWEE